MILSPNIMYNLKNVVRGITALSCLSINTTIGYGQQTDAVCNKSVIGYWHSFDNGHGSGLKLRDVPCSYNVVDIAFLEGASPSDATIVFRLDENKVEKEADLIDDIKLLKARGVKVIASIGGAAGAVAIPNASEKAKFVSSTKALIDKFGFEGLDIDIEGGMITLGGGDNDYNNPTTANIVNLIAAIKEIKQAYGSNFWITMAPEVAYVQGGITSYSGIWGAYLPVIQGLRNELNILHVQYYNGASNMGKDGNNYNQGTPDLIVALSDMLLSGFTMGNGQTFSPLREDQVSFGLPATNGAGNGVMSNADVIKALDYITKGTSFGGKYKLSKSYPNFRGIMTWSVNWDKEAGYGFSNAFSQYFCGSTNLCSSTADVYNMNKETELKIFPNPVTDKIHFERSSTFETITIYNTEGRIVFKRDNFSGNELSINEFPAGLYYLEIINSVNRIHKSFMKL